MSNETSHPSMVEIAERQNLEPNLRRQVAARRFYRHGKLMHFGGASLAIALALVSPLVLLFQPDLGPTLGAVAGAWIFLSRLLLEPYKRRQNLKGASAQEAFDCAVLGTGWNESLARRISEEEVRRASGDLSTATGIRDWYATDDRTVWPASVLMCQRSNAVWARRQHRVYAYALWGAAAAWFGVGIVVSIAHSASLAEYLTTVALPSLPALLDAVEVGRQHREAADNRQLLEDNLDGHLEDGTAGESEIREIQDQLFNLRREAPLVPEWFYRRLKPAYDEDMRYAVERASDGSGTDAA